MADSLLDNVSLNLVETIDDLFAFKRWVGERRESPLGIDTESGNLSPWKSDLRLVQFGDLHTGWALPWDDWKGAIKEIITSWEGEWVCHNLPFEQKFFKIHGGVQLPWDRCHDTLVQAKLDDPMRPAGLKPLSSKLVDRTAAQGQKALDDGMKAQGWTWATVPITFAPYWVYGALDPVLTVHIHQQLYPRVRAAAPEAYDLEMAVLRICTAMMIKGIKVDVPYVRESIEKFEAFSTATRTWLKAVHGITSPLSGGQISRAFIEFGCEITRFTDGGAPQMDKETLTQFKKFAKDPRARQLAEYVLAVRHTEKMKGSYLENFLEMRDSEDLIHTSINTLAARTGRMSATDPALQTLDRDDKTVRGSFIPREDNAFITCDLDQVEGRLGAHFSEDPGLMEAFHKSDHGGTDFFCEIGSSVYLEPIDKKDPRRNIIKTIFYRSQFGGGDNVTAMAEATGVPFDQMHQAKELFDERFPGIKQMLTEVSQESKQNNPPYIRSPLGRKLTLERGQEYTQGYNALIQGHGAEYFKQRLVILDAAGFGDAMVLPVHDEIILEVHRDDVEEAAKTVEDCMTDRTNYKVPLTAGAKILHERWEK
jgi:DNA polymerase-1